MTGTTHPAESTPLPKSRSGSEAPRRRKLPSSEGRRRSKSRPPAYRRPAFPVRNDSSCAQEGLLSGRPMEPGLVTLAKIVGTLLFGMGVVPIIFLLAPGDKTEPAEEEPEHH